MDRHNPVWSICGSVRIREPGSAIVLSRSASSRTRLDDGLPDHSSLARRTSLRGAALLRDPWLNKGTAFSAAERRDFGLEGLLPQQQESLELQVQRVWDQFCALEGPLQGPQQALARQTLPAASALPLGWGGRRRRALPLRTRLNGAAAGSRGTPTIHPAGPHRSPCR